MIAKALLFVLLGVPILLWVVGLEVPAIVAGIFVASSAPSIVQVVRLAALHREWPRISAGPSIVWAGQRIGFESRKKNQGAKRRLSLLAERVGFVPPVAVSDSAGLRPR